MKKDFSRAGEILKAQLMANIVLVLFALSLFALWKNVIFHTIVSFFIYLSAIYLTGWNEGYRDSRNVGERVPDVPRALKAALLSCIFPLILLIVRIVAYHNAVAIGEETTLFLVLSDAVYRLWYFYIVEFMHSGSLFVYIIPILVQVGVYVVAYVVGLKRFDLSEKIMPKILYKKRNK